MTKTKNYSVISILFISFLALIINMISSVHFVLIMLSGVLFNILYLCLKKRYIYSSMVVIFTFLFIEINSGLNPFSLTILSLFLYAFIIPTVEKIVSFDYLNPYINITLFYLGVIFIWWLSFGLQTHIIISLLGNILIDIIFFGLFL